MEYGVWSLEFGGSRGENTYKRKVKREKKKKKITCVTFGCTCGALVVGLVCWYLKDNSFHSNCRI